MNQNPKPENPTFGEVLEARFERRSLLGGVMKAVPLAALFGRGEEAKAAAAPEAEATRNEAKRETRITFQPLTGMDNDDFTCAAGYRHELLIGWGDPLFTDSPAFDPQNQTAAAQARQFGYNCDWMGYFPLPAHDVANPRHAILCVNNEYTNPELMFFNYTGAANQTAEQTAVEQEAHGISVVEVMRDNTGKWRTVVGSQYNRRLTNTTEFTLTGPVAGSDWVKTSADPAGRKVKGTLNNCAGGQTPWGTCLSGEENFHQYFSNAGQTSGAVRANHARYGVPSGAAGYPWARHDDRYDLAKEPNEPFRFGWVVEFDPYQPQSAPRKRTALGRLKHEGCTITVSSSGHAVAYTGDDERFEHFYKFVSKDKYNAFNRLANDSLLDEGTLYAAKLNADGTGEWLPIVYGQGPLTPANGFNSQADVLVNTRAAARLAGATQMDRPEDIESNPVTGRVYVALTNNTSRNDSNKDAANPRASNRYGHVIEISEDNGDHTSTRFFWEVFLLCGDPANAAHGTFFAGYDPKQVSKIANPDNLAFDSKGNLWIATDGQPGTISINDGIFAVPTDGVERGFVRQLASAVRGAEAASLVFNADDTALFVSVQHPGEGGSWTSDPAKLVSTWPDKKGPNRPGVVVVTKDGGNPIIGS